MCGTAERHSSPTIHGFHDFAPLKRLVSAAFTRLRQLPSNVPQIQRLFSLHRRRNGDFVSVSVYELKNIFVPINFSDKKYPTTLYLLDKT